MRNLFRSLVVGGVCAALVGCAPGLGTSLPVGAIPPPPGAPSSGGVVPVRIQKFVDGRAAAVAGTVGDRAIRAEGDIPGAVQSALTDYLKANGFRPSAGEAAAMRGTVLEWNVVVSPGFPSSDVEAVATVELEVLGGQGGGPLYVRRYTGNALTRHPFVNQEKVQQTLGEAMGYALQTAMEDERLLEKLRTSGPEMVPWQ